ncbi:Secreted RxLR effector peptide protein [Phytophthora palmivora]|uniref:RxLR effector protein n=1 Tax=Phytophthora palmivora TaxID=4796 RepID=A0A2P4YUR7_9STRA|nr:Secreted RxLR effector peptide protein [Phytophthora palmivora]
MRCLLYVVLAIVVQASSHVNAVTNEGHPSTKTTTNFVTSDTIESRKRYLRVFREDDDGTPRLEGEEERMPSGLEKIAKELKVRKQNLKKLAAAEKALENNQGLASVSKRMAATSHKAPEGLSSVEYERFMSLYKSNKTPGQAKNQGLLKSGQFSRIRENVDDDEDTEDENLKGEERTLPKLDRVVSDLSADATKGAVKLTRTNSLLPATLDEEVAALKKFYQSIKAQYTTVFKDFAEVKNLNPLQAADEWKIWHKLKTKSMDELASDPFYLFWMKYKQYWDKHHGTAYMN